MIRNGITGALVMLSVVINVHAMEPRLKHQIRIDESAPFNEATFIGTHNSFNSGAYRFWPYIFRYADPNNKLTVTDQLNEGARLIEYDIHWANHGSKGTIKKDAILCHGRPNHFGCWTTDRPLSEGADELKAWLDKNQNEVVILFIQREFSESVSDRIVAYMNKHLGNYLFTPKVIREHEKLPRNCTSLPLGLNKENILANGRHRGAKSQVVILNKYCSNTATNSWHDIAFAGVAGFTDGPIDTKVGGFENAPTEDDPSRDVYPLCSRKDEFINDPNHKTMWRVFEDRSKLNRIIENSKRISAKDMEIMIKCGINLPNLDMLSKNDPRLKAGVWSWAEGYPKNNGGDYVRYQKVENGLTNVTTAQSQHPASCKNVVTDAWQMSSPTSFSNAESTCQSLGHSWHFAMPVNGLDMQQLKDLKQDTFWVNYQRVDSSWQAEYIGLNWALGYPDEGSWQIATNSYKSCASMVNDATPGFSGLKNETCEHTQKVACERASGEWFLSNQESSWFDADRICKAEDDTASFSVPVTNRARSLVSAALKETNTEAVWVAASRNDKGLWRAS